MNGNDLKPRARRSSLALIVVMSLLFTYNALHTYVAMEGLAFWGYPYVSSFGQGLDKGIELKKYQCPLFIANGEVKHVGVSVTNTTGKVMTAYVQTVLTYPNAQYGVAHETEEVTLQAGESKQVTWEIDKGNIVNGRFILARSFVSWQPVYVSNRSVSCHPLVINIFGVPSNMVGIGLFIGLGIATTVLAFFFIKDDSYTKQNHHPRSSWTYMLTALLIMTIGSLIGSWLIGFLMIIFILLGLLAFMQVGNN